MNIDRARRAALFAGILALAGCTHNLITEQPGDLAFGEANRQTMMAQVVDPDPAYDQPQVYSGDHAAQAVEAYRKGAVKEPERLKTTSAIGGGSGGGGGGN
jgi:hypothetical protein